MYFLLCVVGVGTVLYFILQVDDVLQIEDVTDGQQVSV